jgi:folate-binding protein YgfZ
VTETTAPAATVPVVPAEPVEGAVPLPTAPPSPLLARHGAVPAEGRDSGVAWHYGDPTAEQRLLAAGEGAVDLSNRSVVRVAGPDRLSWLNSMTTQELAALPPHTSTEALVLSPHGHVEHALHVVDDGEATWLTLEPGGAPALVEWLLKMRFMLRVEVDDVTADWAVLGEPVGRESAPGEPLAWVDPWPAIAPGGTAYTAPDVDHPAVGRAWREVLVPRAELAAVAPPRLAGTWAADALRVAAWRPRLGFETDHRTIPHEVDWLRTAVHLQKGCYRGQETVARVHNLGRPPRRLVLLHLDGSGHELPEPGAEVFAGERKVGFVTTPARHHEDGPIALALIKRSTPADIQLLADGVDAAQETIVAP